MGPLAAPRQQPIKDAVDIGIAHQHSRPQALLQSPALYVSFSFLCALSSAPTRTQIIFVCAGLTPRALLRCFVVNLRPGVNHPCAVALPGESHSCCFAVL